MKSSWTIKFFIVVLMLFTLPFAVSAQTISCNTPQEKAQCQAALDQVNAEIEQVQAQLKSTQAQSASLSRDIKILDSKIRAAQLDIKAKNLLIQTLGNTITEKQSKIDALEARITRGKETISTILRKTNEVDSYSLPEVILSQSSVAGFFNDLDNFESLQAGLKSTFEQIRSDQASTSAEKTALTNRKNAEIDARYAIQQQQKNIEANKAEQNRLLAISKGNEKAYTAEVTKKAAEAAKIRAALFPLAGGQQIPFGQALQYAQNAQKLTGIRPAFLLAVITQESNLGANVGSCYVTDLTSGNGISKKTGSAFEQVMKAPRDTGPFLNITKSLGIDWATTPVSCPIGDKLHNYDGSKYYLGRGFGGAMGPAQFIPSTWDNGTENSFKNRVSKVLGIANPSPWNPEHAFIASALYLIDLGAINGSYTGEIRAACSYFGTRGSSCSYGKQVLDKAYNIQITMINLL